MAPSLRPSDTLIGAVEVIENRSSGSKPSPGDHRDAITLTNQDGDVVLTLAASTFHRRETA